MSNPKIKLFLRIIIACEIILIINIQILPSESGNISAISEVHSIYIVNNGIHTGIVMQCNKDSGKYISVTRYFQGYEYIDFGWGDADYYQAGTGGAYLTFKALFLPTGSTVRVHGTNMSLKSITEYCEYSVQFEVSENHFAGICKFIDKSFIKKADGSFTVLSQNTSGNTVFYESVYTYHVFNTCNTWIADALKSGNIEIPEKLIITSDGLYKAISKTGEIIKPL